MAAGAGTRLGPKSPNLPQLRPNAGLEEFCNFASPCGVLLLKLNSRNEEQHYLFQPAREHTGSKSQGNWIRIERESAFNMIETLPVLWLGGWSLFAGFGFLRSTGILAF